MTAKKPYRRPRGAKTLVAEIAGGPKVRRGKDGAYRVDGSPSVKTINKRIAKLANGGLSQFERWLVSQMRNGSFMDGADTKTILKAAWDAGADAALHPMNTLAVLRFTSGEEVRIPCTTCIECGHPLGESGEDSATTCAECLIKRKRARR